MEDKNHQYSSKDIKRKLSFIHKKINDLHHQRKLVYKNSVKVKKMIHNQINQVVKCLLRRERMLWNEIDEAHISQDTSISQELSKLQSVHASCQSLCNHSQDFKEKSDSSRIMYSILSDINFDEKAEFKPLEFISDFEAMKVKANSYGHLEGDFIKKEDFILLSPETDNDVSNADCNDVHKEEIPDQSPSLSNAAVSSENCSPKTTDIEDFQIIDLLDNMSCYDLDEDIAMTEDASAHCASVAKEFDGSSAHKNESTSVASTSNSFGCSNEAHETANDFNPEEEWKQIQEMNEKIASFHEMTSQLCGEVQMKNKKTKKELNTATFPNKSSKYRLLSAKEVADWLYFTKPKNSTAKSSNEIITIDVNCISPAKVIQKSFIPYFTKTDFRNWLSQH